MVKWDLLLEIFTPEQISKLLTAVLRTVAKTGDMVAYEKKLTSEIEMIALNPISVVYTPNIPESNLFNTTTVKLILDRIKVYRDLYQYAINIENTDNGPSQFLVFTTVAIDDGTHNIYLTYSTNNNLTALFYDNFPSYMSKLERVYKLSNYTEPMELAEALAKIVAEG